MPLRVEAYSRIYLGIKMGNSRFTVHVRYESRGLTVTGELFVLAATPGKGRMNFWESFKFKLKTMGFIIDEDNTSYVKNSQLTTSKEK